MATRSERLNEFVTDRDPPSGCFVELLCEDHVGTYLIPFPCERADGKWINGRTGDAIEAEVLGWRNARIAEKPASPDRNQAAESPTDAG
ncbi:hypothetical protein [Microvirga lenta]|uniref:hypothetical protein n=1 Tax=Microvirga lenta TaxID=2881337 RepID=UPI001CFFE789|nr:hypothetical protein [Microvirga lenta]MCB5175409.1 hypothetical protein [Microvirga lenta]